MDFLAEAAEFPFILRHDVVRPVLRVEVVRDIAHREPGLLELAEREQEERMVVRLEMELSALLEQAAVFLEDTSDGACNAASSAMDRRN
jgi:hypothetical protein